MNDKINEEVCNFKKYVSMVMDLMVDAYKWKKCAEHSDSSETREKYMQISNTLMEMFMIEHNRIGEKMKENKSTE